MATPSPAQFQADVAAMVFANRDDPAAAARYLNDLVETQVITLEASQAIWAEVTGISPPCGVREAPAQEEQP